MQTPMLKPSQNRTFNGSVEKASGFRARNLSRARTISLSAHEALVSGFWVRGIGVWELGVKGYKVLYKCNKTITVELCRVKEEM